MNLPLTPDRQGTVLLTLCAMFLLLVLGLVAFVESLQNGAQRQLMQGRPGATQLLVLLDVSDPPTPDQGRQLEERLQYLTETTLQPGDVVTVWTLGESREGPLRRALRMVRPPREANPLFQNPRRTLEQYDSGLTRPLHDLVKGLPDVTPSQWSPILEAINTLAELPELRGGGERRLLLVSDLAQHSRSVSFLARQPTLESFARDPFATRGRPNLRGVAVGVFVLPRARQNLDVEVARRRFWQAYLRDCGATSVEIERL